IAFVVAMIGRPLMNLMHNKLRIPNAIAAILTITLFITLFVGFISLFISLVLNEPLRFWGNFVHLDRFEEALAQQLQMLSDSLGFLDIPILKNYLNNAMETVDIKSISGIFGDSLTTLGILMIDAFSVVFITFFFLKDRDLINKMIVAIAPNGEEKRF